MHPLNSAVFSIHLNRIIFFQLQDIWAKRMELVKISVFTSVMTLNIMKKLWLAA